MVSYVSTTLDSMDRDASAVELGVGGQDVLRGRVAAQSNGRFMLKEKEHIIDALVPSCLNQRVL